MQAYQERVIRERAELSEKLAKLSAFITSPAYETLYKQERDLLEIQANVMRTYVWVLNRRIDRFAVTEGADVETASNAPAGAKGSEGTK